jgi:hypothetical protein
MTSPPDTRVTRRRFGLTAGCAPASVAFGEAGLVATRTSPESDGRLTARPPDGVVTSLKLLQYACESHTVTSSGGMYA